MGELRDRLLAEGMDDPHWYEVPKSKKAAKRARKAVERVPTSCWCEAATAPSAAASTRSPAPAWPSASSLPAPPTCWRTNLDVSRFEGGFEQALQSPDAVEARPELLP